MRTLIRLCVGLPAAAIGVVGGWYLTWVFVGFTYKCSQQPGNPCDAGAMVGLGIMLLLCPLLSLICVALGDRLLTRRFQR